MRLRGKITIAIILFVLIIAFIITFFFRKDETNNDNNQDNEVKIVDEIKEYGYQLEEGKSELYQKLFKELNTILTAEEVNEIDYAKKVTELFIADFYDLDSKPTKNNVGGLDFIHPDYKLDFIKYAQNSIYKYIENDIYNDRTQELPTVRKVVKSDAVKTTFTYGKITDENAYKVEVIWEYQKELGYETVANVTLIHDDNKLFIAAMD